MDVPGGLIGKIFGDKSESNDSVANSGTHAGANNAAPESRISDPAVKDATLDSKTKPAVEHEQVNTIHEEKVQEVVEKEKHQDHYHTTIQPLKDREVLPEKHDYQETATQERSYNYDDADTTNAKLNAEKPGLANTSRTGTTTESKTEESAISGGEQVHHHYHETVQPVIEKETVQPTVTHTKVPVHETYQEESVVHKTSIAEPMSVDAFEKSGQTLDKSL